MVFKNVYFHQLSIYERQFIKSKKNADTLNKSYFSIKEKDDLLIQLLTENLNEFNTVKIGDNYSYRGESLELLNKDEVFNNKSNFIFARLGKMQDIHQFQLRNQDTLEASEIIKDSKQQLEVFTYLMIDRSNYIISFLKQQSAPALEKLSDLIRSKVANNEIFAEVSSITVEDAIPILSNKDLIGSISYKVSIPPEGSEVFNIENTGLSEKEYDMLSNQKSIDFTVKLVAERDFSAFEQNPQRLGSTLKKLVGISDQVKVKARNEEEYMQDYTVIDNPFTRKQKFNFDKNAESISSEIYKQMIEVYRSNKSDIERFYRE